MYAYVCYVLCITNTHIVTTSDLTAIEFEVPLCMI